MRGCCCEGIERVGGREGIFAPFGEAVERRGETAAWLGAEEGGCERRVQD